MPVPNHCPLRHLLASCLMSAISMAATAAEPGRHVVAIVCDGLRPDLVTEADMPILTRLGRDGVFFANHHPVYISSTEVNGTALATGVYPRTSGVIANHEYRPDIELLQPIDTEHPWAAWQADRLSGGQYIKTDTIAELLQRTGRHTVVAGTKGVALLWDRKYRPTDASSPRLFEGITRPAALLDSIEPDMGPLPLRANPKAAANARQDEWTTRVLTERLWSNGIPAFTVLWLSEPDFAQHGSGPGTAVGRAALRSSDANIGRMIEALRMAGELDKTDILVMSDHGFSTVSRHLEMPDLLDQAGFKVVTDADRNLAPGEVMPVSTSGSVLFYVGGHDAKVAADLVAFLQKSDFAGVIFTQQPQFGTFPLSQVRMDSPAPPDVLVSMRWSADRSKVGLPGMLASEGKKYKAGQGMHGSLSAFDMHNTLIAAGPSFRKGYRDELPSGNTDVAPTVMTILGLTPDKAIEGRVLTEALVGSAAPAEHPRTQTLEASRDLGGVIWRQYLKVTTLSGRLYIDEGNCRSDAEQSAAK